jgi:ABC-type nitrate/sulfonate/bicarbonate transport system substrate-binding protein
MSRRISRRSAVKALGGTGLCAGSGTLGALLSTACSKKHGEGMPVRVMSSQGIVGVTIQSLMSRKGYFREQGLDAEVLSVESGTNIIGPLLQQDADICIFAGFSQLIAAIEKGADLRIVAGASVRGQQALFSKDPAIQTVKDLEGHAVGVGAIGAQLHQVATALFKKKGVDLNKIQFVNIGNSSAVFRAVVAGTVAAGDGEADVLGILDRLGVHMLKDGDYADELPEYTWQASFTSSATIRTQREALVRTLAAYCKAYRYVQSPASQNDFVNSQLDALHPNNREEAIGKATSQWNYLQTRKPYAEDLVLSEERLEYMQKLNIDLGVQKKMLPYDKVIDASLAKEAVARLG